MLKMGVFFRARQHFIACKIQIYLIPCSGFLTIDTTFVGKYVICTNICPPIFEQSELKVSDLDQNWARTRFILFKCFELPNAMDNHIVHSRQEQHQHHHRYHHHHHQHYHYQQQHEDSQLHNSLVGESCLQPAEVNKMSTKLDMR